MTIIKQNASEYVTQINVIEVAPENQQILVELMSEQAEQVMRNLPGFVSINLHQSDDGTRVVNYVQWQSKELLDAAHQEPKFAEHFERYKPYLIKGGPKIYKVVYSTAAPNENS